MLSMVASSSPDLWSGQILSKGKVFSGWEISTKECNETYSKESLYTDFGSRSSSASQTSAGTLIFEARAKHNKFNHTIFNCLRVTAASQPNHPLYGLNVYFGIDGDNVHQVTTQSRHSLCFCSHLLFSLSSVLSPLATTLGGTLRGLFKRISFFTLTCSTLKEI